MIDGTPREAEAGSSAMPKYLDRVLGARMVNAGLQRCCGEEDASRWRSVVAASGTQTRLWRRLGALDNSTKQPPRAIAQAANQIRSSSNYARTHRARPPSVAARGDQRTGRCV